MNYVDFHTHTIRSDGAYSPMELCRRAMEAGIRILGITDHNYTEDLTALRAAFPQIRFIQGAEVSCIYKKDTPEEKELHIIALGFDPSNPKIKSVLARNHPDRRPYVNAILDKLRRWGIDLGTYDDLRKLIPDKHHIGRMDMARIMVERGYVESIEKAFDEYLGGHGARKAYVPNTLRYVSLEEGLEAILDAGGIAILAHLYYYLLSDEENEELVGYFKSLTGNRGGMEVFYSLYDQQQRDALKNIALRHELLISVASDYHGQSENETLAQGFQSSDCSALLLALGV